MPNAPKFRSYGNYSGPVIQGSIAYKPLSIVGHWDRAFIIAAEVECNAMMGAVVMYDGTVVTAGLHQAVLVYPQTNGIGPLAKLLTMLDHIPHFQAKDDLWAKMAKNGWKIQADNLIYTVDKQVTPTLRCKAGDTVVGTDLRNTITPPAGKVPPSGTQWIQACDWAQKFSAIMSDPRTFDMQVSFGVESTIETAKARKIGNVSVLYYMYNGTVLPQPFANCGELDLAMVMYHSNAVNAPAIANKCLNAAIASTKFPGMKVANVGQKAFLAKELVRLMGTSDYGQWTYSLPNGRYQRTRSCMMQSKFWPDALFSATGIMPRDLPG